jgi:hypothetical protein
MLDFLQSIVSGHTYITSRNCHLRGFRCFEGTDTEADALYRGACLVTDSREGIDITKLSYVCTSVMLFGISTVKGVDE